MTWLFCLQDGGEVTCNNTMAEVEREFTAKRAKLGKELQELNKILQKKETLSKQMTESGSHISQMKAQYEVRDDRWWQGGWWVMTYDDNLRWEIKGHDTEMPDDTLQSDRWKLCMW